MLMMLFIFTLWLDKLEIQVSNAVDYYVLKAWTTAPFP